MECQPSVTHLLLWWSRAFWGPTATWHSQVPGCCLCLTQSPWHHWPCTRAHTHSGCPVLCDLANACIHTFLPDHLRVSSIVKSHPSVPKHFQAVSYLVLHNHRIITNFSKLHRTHIIVMWAFWSAYNSSLWCWRQNKQYQVISMSSGADWDPVFQEEKESTVPAFNLMPNVNMCTHPHMCIHIHAHIHE